MKSRKVKVMSLKVKQSINMLSVAVVLLCVYVFFSYNALNIIFPQVLNSISLYAFIACSAFVFVVHIKTKKDTFINIYTIWYLLFMTMSAFSMLYSEENNLFSGAFYLMIVSFAISFFYVFLVKERKTFDIVCSAYFVSSIVLIITLMLTGNMNPESSERLGKELIGNSNTFASMICTSAMYGIWVVIFKKINLIVKSLMVGGLVLNFYALALSGGRRSFVVPIIFLFVIMLVKAKSVSYKKVVKYLVVIVALIVLVVYAVSNIDVLYESIGIRFEGLINGITGSGTQDNSSRMRDEMRRLASQTWIDNPIFGHGFDSFKYLALEEIGAFAYSHCNYTELLYNNGLVGFLLYYSIFALILFKALKQKNVAVEYRAFAIGIIVSFLISDYGGITYNTVITQHMIALAIVVLNFKKELKNE